MPTIYRSMKHAADGLPVVGSNARELGVRIPPSPHADIDLDAAGHVIRNGRGMSVVAHWRDLLAHLVPKRLVPRFPGACGVAIPSSMWGEMAPGKTPCPEGRGARGLPLPGAVVPASHAGK